MKKNMLSLRTKAEVIIAVALLIGIAISGVVSVTVTESGGTLFVDGSISVTGSFLGTGGSSAPTLVSIRNSNNNSWAATNANIQLAIDDLTSGGTVYLPSGIIYITSTIDLPNDVTIQGVGNATILKLGSNANVSIFKNTGWGNQGEARTENRNIHIKDMTLNGNSYTHELWSKDTDSSTHTDIISLIYTNYSSINNVRFVNATFRGICLRTCSYFDIKDCYFDDIGMHKYKWNWGTGVDLNCDAIAIFTSNNVTVSGCSGSRIYGNAITIEWGLHYFGGLPISITSHDMIVTACRFDTAYAGIWIEGNAIDRSVRNIAISDCIFTNITVVGPYEASDPGWMSGMAILRNTWNISISNCHIRHAGNFTNEKGYGIRTGGELITITNCIIEDIGGDGIRASNDRITITNCIVANTLREGIFIAPSSQASGIKFQPIVANNRIYESGKNGICLNGSAAAYDNDPRGGVCSGNTIYKSGATWFGIWSNLWNMSITNNIIEGYNDGIGSAEEEISYCIYSNNRITGTARDGIEITGYYNVVNSNIIDNCVGDGIEMNEAYYTSVSSNQIRNCADGIDETGSSDYNIYIGNIVTDITNDDYDINGANCLPPWQNRSYFNIGTFA